MRGSRPVGPCFKWLSAATIFALIGLSAFAEEAEDASAVISDSRGAIAEILLQFDIEQVEETAPAYSDLFRQLPEGVAINVISANEVSTDEFIGRWGEIIAEGSHDLTVTEIDHPVSMWARDRHIARCDRATLEPAKSFIPTAWKDYDEPKKNDIRSLREMSRLGFLPSTLPHELHLEGGNLVSNNRHAFIGCNVLDENPNFDERIFSNLTDISGRDIVIVADNSADVPWGHVDMYLTPIDEETILVASADCGEDFAAEIWSALPPDLAAQIDLTENMSRSLDDIALQLEAEGYKVHRLPVLPSTGPWMITYNNVVFDYREDKRRVFMPAYGIPDFDNRAKRTYERLGFEVCPVDVSHLFKEGGAVRCIVNVIRRQPAIVPDSADHETTCVVRHISIPCESGEADSLGESSRIAKRREASKDKARF